MFYNMVSNTQYQEYYNILQMYMYMYIRATCMHVSAIYMGNVPFLCAQLYTGLSCQSLAIPPLSHFAVDNNRILGKVIMSYTIDKIHMHMYMYKGLKYLTITYFQRYTTVL